MDKFLFLNFSHSEIKNNVLFQDEDILVINKPAGVVVDDIPKRVHRLDKDTSGIFLVAKNDKALEFFQKQFKERKVKKKYLCLVAGHLKDKEGEMKTLLGRSPKDRRKQKVFLSGEPQATGKRGAVTKYKVLERFKNYDLVEVVPKTGRKHQIRCHLAYLGHPIAGDKLYGFKGQICPSGLKRQFLHANYLKIKLPNGTEKEFSSKLPEELTKIIKGLEISN